MQSGVLRRRFYLESLLFGAEVADPTHALDFECFLARAQTTNTPTPGTLLSAMQTHESLLSIF